MTVQRPASDARRQSSSDDLPASSPGEPHGFAAPIRGIVFGLLIVSPFWAAVAVFVRLLLP